MMSSNAASNFPLNQATSNGRSLRQRRPVSYVEITPDAAPEAESFRKETAALLGAKQDQKRKANQEYTSSELSSKKASNITQKGDDGTAGQSTKTIKRAPRTTRARPAKTKQRQAAAEETLGDDEQYVTAAGPTLLKGGNATIKESLIAVLKVGKGKSEAQKHREDFIAREAADANERYEAALTLLQFSQSAGIDPLHGEVSTRRAHDVSVDSSNEGPATLQLMSSGAASTHQVEVQASAPFLEFARNTVPGGSSHSLGIGPTQAPSLQYSQGGDSPVQPPAEIVTNNEVAEDRGSDFSRTLSADSVDVEMAHGGVVTSAAENVPIKIIATEDVAMEIVAPERLFPERPALQQLFPEHLAPPHPRTGSALSEADMQRIIQQEEFQQELRELQRRSDARKESFQGTLESQLYKFHLNPQ